MFSNEKLLKAKKNCRKALENKCTTSGISFNDKNTNADLCRKINIYLKEDKDKDKEQEKKKKKNEDPNMGRNEFLFKRTI